MKFFYGWFLLLSMVFVFCVAQNGFTQEKQSGGFMINYPAAEKEVSKTSGQAKKSVSGEIHKTVAYVDSRKTNDENPVSDSSVIIAKLKKIITVKNSEIKLLENRLSKAEKELEAKETELFMAGNGKKRLYEVKKDESLWKIAKRHDVYNDPYMWIKIYNANIEKIDNKNVIYPGQLFEIPK